MSNPTPMPEPPAMTDEQLDGLCQLLTARDKLTDITDRQLTALVLHCIWAKKVGWCSQEEFVLDEYITRFERMAGIQRNEDGEVLPANASLEVFWQHQSAWSQATFGPDSERGPIGPLKHLAKEVAEVMKDPHDLMEFVDCLFLIFDSTRRAGFNFDQLREAAWKKLAINKARKWQTPPKGDEAIEHVRD
jgi:hypothetical protein